MSFSDALENELLEHILNNANIADIGDATGLRGSTTAGDLYVALHTADPGESGDQSTNEATYTGYARVAISRSGAGWTVTGNSASPASDITFPQCTAGTETITHVSVGVDSVGATKMIFSAAVSPNISVSNGVTPIIGSGSTLTLD